MYLEIKDVKKSYGQDGSYVQVLKGINTSLEKGQMCVIQGTSGSGKSTLVIIGALIGIPVAKLIIDTIFPIFIANVACTVHLEYRWYHYAILFAGIMLCYRLIITLLAGKLNRITPAEVLKNRE